MAGTLTRTDVHALSVIDDTAMKTAKVARFVDALNDVVLGTARHFCRNDSGAFLGATDDIRDAFLRVTTKGGLEVFWPVSELMEDVSTGQFAAYDW